MAHEVFISYSHQDQAAAERVCAYLEEKGLSCWIAPRDIFGGEDFGEAISGAIQSCRVVVLIFSSASAASRQIGRELKLADDNDKTVLPVRIENVPAIGNFGYYLGGAQFLEAVDGLTEGHLQRLSGTLENYLRQVPAPLPPTKAAKKETALPRAEKINWLRSRRFYAGLALVALVSVATALYVRLGFPSAGRSAALPTPVNVRAKVNPDDGQRYISIAPGSFRMGCSDSDAYCFPNERPAHSVSIARTYWIQQTEVSVGVYRKFAHHTGAPMPAVPRFEQRDDHPVVNVSWNEAYTYCRWAGGRLPSEAEWEYAARAGSIGPRYGDLDAIAWYGKNSKGSTHAAGTKSANAWGLYDMLGNVWEWCNDWYSEDFYSKSPSGDPNGPAVGAERVVRGAAWDSYVWGARASSRSKAPPESRAIVVGFRCVRDVMP
jgi:formylglycine-generating enzyme required for sulfatase activity